MSDHSPQPQVPGDSDRLIAKCFWITTIGIAVFALAVYILVPEITN